MRFGKLAKESVWAALTKGSTFVYFFLTLVILTRALGQETFGAWSYFFSAFNVVLLISMLGLNDAARIFVARQRHGDFRKPLLTGAALRAAASLVLALLLFLGAPAIAGLMARPEFTLLFQWGALLLLSQTFTEFLKAIFEGLHRIKYNFIVNTIEHGGKLALILLWVPGAPTPGIVLACFIAATALTAAAGAAMLYFVFYRNAPSEPAPPLAGPMARYAVPMFILIAGFVIATELDTLMIGWFKDDAEVGRYAAAKQIAAKLPHIGAMFAMGVLQVYAAKGPEDRRYLQRLTRRLTALTAAIYALIGAGILLFAKPLLPWLFGAEFAGSAAPLQLMIPFIFIYGVSRILSGILDYRGRAWKRALYLFIATTLNFLLNLWLIPRHGAEGAAIATSIAYFPYIVLNYIEVQRSLHAIPDGAAPENAPTENPAP